jgi:hypothetical protein
MEVAKTIFKSERRITCSINCLIQQKQKKQDNDTNAVEKSPQSVN